MSTLHKIGHVHLKVRDLERSRLFYTDVLGLAVRERVGRYLFLTFGQEHHDLALQEVGLDAESPLRNDVGLYHLAIEVPSVAALKRVYRCLQAAAVPTRPVDHGISKVLYFSDHDGNGIEVYIDTRAETGRDNWEGLSSPFDVLALPE